MKDPLSKLTNCYTNIKRDGGDKQYFADCAIELIKKEIFPLIDWPTVKLLEDALKTYWVYGGRCTQDKMYRNIKLSKTYYSSDKSASQDFLQHMNHLSWLLDLFAVCHYDGRNFYQTGFILKPGRPKIDDQDLIIISKFGTVLVNPLPAFIVEGYNDVFHYPTIQHYRGHYDERYLYDYFGFFARLANARLVKTERIEKSIEAIKNSSMPIVWPLVNV